MGHCSAYSNLDLITIGECLRQFLPKVHHQAHVPMCSANISHRKKVSSSTAMLNDRPSALDLRKNTQSRCAWETSYLSEMQVCDRLGLYVVDEANIETHGMEPTPSRLARDPSWRKAHMERLQVSDVSSLLQPGQSAETQQANSVGQMIATVRSRCVAFATCSRHICICCLVPPPYNFLIS